MTRPDVEEIELWLARYLGTLADNARELIAYIHELEASLKVADSLIQDYRGEDK
jgi:hypothetical protein